MGSKRTPRDYLSERSQLLQKKIENSTKGLMQELQSDPIRAKEAVIGLLRMEDFGPTWEGSALLEAGLEERALRLYDNSLWMEGSPSKDEREDRRVLVRALFLLLEHIEIEKRRAAKPPKKPNDEELCTLCHARLATHMSPEKPGHTSRTVRYDVGPKRRKPRRDQRLRAIARFAFKTKAHTSVLSFAQLVEEERGLSAIRVTQIIKGISPERS